MTERSFDRVQGANPATSYERFFVPAIGEPLATDLVRLTAVRPAERVLDVACGTGIVARLASQQVGPTGVVAGLDVSPDMLAVARSATPPGVPIEWHVGRAEDMPFPDASFDLVLCQMGLQFVPDRPAALREMLRVLAQGGRLALSTPGPTPRLFSILEDALARRIGAQAASLVPLVFSLHDSAQIRDLVAEAGFRDVSVRADTRTLSLPAPQEFLWQYVQSTPLAGALAGASDEQRASLESDVVAGWRELVGDRPQELQVRMVVATARR